MDDRAGLPIDFYLTEADRALLMAPTTHEMARDWQGLARAGLELLAGGAGLPGAAGRLSRALAAGAALNRATTPREVAAATAKICAEAAADREAAGDDATGWAELADELTCWAWVGSS